MTYTNPLLKYVKKIKEMCSLICIDTYVAEKITDQCNLLLETKKKKPLNSGGVKSGKNQDDECTAGPYCKCEDCRNYEGDLPIDRV